MTRVLDSNQQQTKKFVTSTTFTFAIHDKKIFMLQWSREQNAYFYEN